MNNESRLRTLAAHQSLMVVALQAVAQWKNILKINLTLRITYLIYMGEWGLTGIDLYPHSQTKTKGARMTKKYKVVIQWGLTTLPDSEVKTYYFETEKEMESFLDGVHEASGWLDYEIKEEGRND